MENTPAFHPLDYLSVVRRRKWWLVTPLVASLVVGVLLLLFLPRQYEAVATLGVSLPAVSGPILSEAQRVTTEERIRSINQLVTSETVLQRVVREEGLDKQMPLPEAVQHLRANVKTSMPPPNPSLPPGTMEHFFIHYEDAAPAVTQRIANRLADTFVQESSRRREVRAEETAAFIGNQVMSSQMRLSELEQRLRSAKEAFMGALPEQTEANVAMATGLQQQLETTTNALRGEQDRLSVIERSIEAMRAGAANELAAAGVPATASLRAADVERRLEAARANYTDKHPEIIRLREDLAAARAAEAAEASRPEADRVASLRVDPNYRALVADRDQARLRIRELQRSEAQIRGQIGLYRSRVESAPRVEQQLATVQREYDLEKEQYRALTTKLRNAEISESLERNNGSERFTVLARATLPKTPVSPNTPRLLLVTILLGVCLGGGLALGREYLDRSIYDARALSDIEPPVLGEIPRIVNA